MFSRKGSIYLAFGEESDTYYTEGLLRLNLRQYLWMELHKSYPVVYFLRKEDAAFAVTTFGDKERDLPDGRTIWQKWQKLWGDSGAPNRTLLTAQRFGRQLAEWTEQGAAVVCPLNDFCQVMDNAEALPLRVDNKGVLVLTASIYAESNAEALLSSKVFAKDRLDFQPLLATREASECGLYELLERRGCCVFLNTPTPERLHAILQRVLFENPQWMEDSPDLDAMARYLACCLQEPVLQEQRNLENLRALGSPVCYAPFQKIYACLQEERTWNQLLACSRESPDKYVTGYTTILRDPQGYAARCQMASLEMPAFEKEEVDSLLWNKANQGLRQIREWVDKPRNKLENPEIVKDIEYFLTCYQKKTGKRTSCWLIFSISVCVVNVCVVPDSDKGRSLQKIVELMKSVYAQSEELFEKKCEQKNVRAAHEAHGWERDGFLNGSASLEKKQLQNLEEQIKVKETVLAQCMDIVYGTVIQLSNQGYTQIQKDLKRFHEVVEELAEPIENVPVEQRKKLDEVLEPEKKREPTSSDAAENASGKPTRARKYPVDREDIGWKPEALRRR